MKESWILELDAQRLEIRRRWTEILRLERTDEPMADPENLLHLIDWTLKGVFAALRSRKVYHGGALPPKVVELREGCRCGHNPYLSHFLAGEQALIEALARAQAREAPLDTSDRESSLTELYMVIHAVARSEVELFCSICQRSPSSGTPNKAKAAETGA
jgi:hypothetical protein